MYFETQIGKLSKVQLNNLLKGKNVRIKSGTSHVIYLTEMQAKKFHRHVRQGKALTIKLNQEQIAKQGSGILGDLIGMVHPTMDRGECGNGRPGFGVHSVSQKLSANNYKTL